MKRESVIGGGEGRSEYVLVKVNSPEMLLGDPEQHVAHLGRIHAAATQAAIQVIHPMLARADRILTFGRKWPELSEGGSFEWNGVAFKVRFTLLGFTGVSLVDMHGAISAGVAEVMNEMAAALEGEAETKRLTPNYDHVVINAAGVDVRLLPPSLRKEAALRVVSAKVIHLANSGDSQPQVALRRPPQPS